MADFLSEAWLADLDRAVRAAGLACGPPPLAIDQVVRDVPGRGEVRYRLVVDAHGARVAAADDPTGPALRLTADYATAVAIANGHENAQRALADGRLRLGGDVEVLVRHAGTLAAMHDVTATLRAATTFPGP